MILTRNERRYMIPVQDRNVQNTSSCIWGLLSVSSSEVESSCFFSQMLEIDGGSTVVCLSEENRRVLIGIQYY